ncbi:M15 family metallopeptidase [Clostridium butanoliproducens]|uniref:M15 family metallopeptidase n=1 Tax=Clostridium butanoliproducens TaxID=2991837 RepID=UPI0024B91E7B|nr:M15 family metallopeptidase [Clostridium butanoliproducens]
MKKICSLIIVFTLFISQFYNINVYAQNMDYDTTMKQDLLSLFMAYPDHLVDVEKQNNGLVYLVTKSGNKIVYDDKKEKTQQEKLANGDLQDMMEQIYPLEKIDDLMEENFDPGRIRAYSLLNEVYGSSREQIEKNLTNVNFAYQNYRFNKNNSAAESLDKVSKTLLELTKTNNKIGAFINPANGTFNYRIISGTGRLSAHAYGIAIDIASDKRDYWKWATRDQGKARLLQYPDELVKIFEENNFIWGGKWGHFDILHFEYRPEIILKAKYFGHSNKERANWYEGVPNDERIREYIEKIDKL